MFLNLIKNHLKNPVLIKKPENLFYLTGRSLENKADEFLLVTPKNTNKKRMSMEAVAFGYGLEKIDWFKKVDRLKNIGKYLNGYKQLDIEYGFTYAEGDYVRSKSQEVRVKPARSIVDVMRQLKTSEEILKVKKSMQIVETVFRLVKKEIKKPGMTEIRLAQFIKNNGLRLGAHDVSFPPIVASGSNAAIPHHVPGNKKLVVGESIILDFGFKYKNYCSDFTRTVFLKKVGSKKIEEAYNQVEKAYNGCIDLFNLPSRMQLRDPLMKGIHRFQLRQGSVEQVALSGDQVYQKAVDILAEKKLDKYFIHSLGHGTGLEIHELPNLSPKSKDRMQNGMVFSIEPGVYIPKLGGIRIEDLVYLKNNTVEKFINVPTKIENNIL